MCQRRRGGREEGCGGTYKVGGLAVSVTAPSAAGDVLSNVDLCPLRAGAGGVDHAGVGAGTVRVDLVKRHLELATGADLGQGVARGSKDLLSTRLDVVGTCSNGLPAGVCSIASETGSIGLERVTPGAITRCAANNWWLLVVSRLEEVEELTSNGRSISASITLSTDDGGVAGHQRAGSTDDCYNNGGEVHGGGGVGYYGLDKGR